MDQQQPLVGEILTFNIQKQRQRYQKIFQKDSLNIIKNFLKSQEIFVKKYQLFFTNDKIKQVKDAYAYQPYKLIGRVIRYKQNKNKPNGRQHHQGTGLLIGPRVVLTVAHNLFNQQKTQIGDKFYFYPQTKPNTKTSHLIRVKRYIFHQQYLVSKSHNYDLAVLILQKSVQIQIKQFNKIQLKCDFNFKTEQNKKILISGYHGQKNFKNQQFDRPIQFEETNYAMKIFLNNLLKYKHSTFQGNSGGPLIQLQYNSKGQVNFYLIGLHIAGFDNSIYAAGILLGASQSINPQLIKIIRKFYYDQKQSAFDNNKKSIDLIQQILSIEKISNQIIQINQNFFVDKLRHLIISNEFLGQSNNQKKFENDMFNGCIPIIQKQKLKNIPIKFNQQDEKYLLLSPHIWNSIFGYIQETDLNEQQENIAFEIINQLFESNFLDCKNEFQFCGEIGKKLRYLQTIVYNRRTKKQSDIRESLKMNLVRKIPDVLNIHNNDTFLKICNQIEEKGLIQAFCKMSFKNNNTNQQTNIDQNLHQNSLQKYLYKFNKIMQTSYLNVDKQMRKQNLLLNQLNFLYNNHNYRKALWYCIQRDPINEQSLQICVLKGNIFKETHYYHTSIYHFEKAIFILNKRNYNQKNQNYQDDQIERNYRNDEHWIKKAMMHYEIAQNYFKLNDLQEAEFNIKQSQRYIKLTKNWLKTQQYVIILNLKISMLMYNQDDIKSLSNDIEFVFTYINKNQLETNIFNNLIFLFNLGRIMQQFQSNNTAIKIFKEGLQLISRIYGRDYILNRYFLIPLAQSYRLQKNYKKAIKQYTNALKIYLVSHGKQSNQCLYINWMICHCRQSIGSQTQLEKIGQYFEQNSFNRGLQLTHNHINQVSPSFLRLQSSFTKFKNIKERNKQKTNMQSQQMKEISIEATNDQKK